MNKLGTFATVITSCCCAQIATAVLPTYSIGAFTAINGTIAGLNDDGSYLQTGGGGWQLVTSSGTTTVPTGTGNATYPQGSFYGLSESGVCFGFAQTGPGGQQRPAVWTAANGWQIMTAGPFRSQAVGVTNGGKALYRGNTSSTGVPESPGWWQIGSSPTPIPQALYSVACDAAGNALFNQYSATVLGKVIRVDSTVVSLRYNGVDCFANNMSRVGGFVCGQVGGLTGHQSRSVVWDLAGQVQYSIALSDFGGNELSYVADVNAARTSVGTLSMGNSTTAYVHSSSDGLATINSRLTGSSTGWNIIASKQINSSGQIIAQAYAPGESQYREVLLNPVPEPAPFIALSLGVAALLRRKRQ